MTSVLVLAPAYLARAHHVHGSTLSMLARWVVHAAVWHLVSRLLYRLPLPVDVAVVALVAVGFVLLRRRRRPLAVNDL